MSDLVERAAVIDELWRISDKQRGSVYATNAIHSAFAAVKALPSAEPECNLDEWCHDCKEYDHDKHCCPRWNRVIRTALEEAQPERKRGKWVGVKEYCDHLNEKAEREGNGHRFIPSGMNICVYCNQCWESNDRRTTYCPNCGADMRGGEECTKAQ